jgi:hypothetical protein
MGTERARSGLEFWDIKPQTTPRGLPSPIFPELFRAGRYPVPFAVENAISGILKKRLLVPYA